MPLPLQPRGQLQRAQGPAAAAGGGHAGRKLDYYQGFLARGRPVFARREAEQGQALRPCPQCGYPTSSGDLCGVCRIRAALRDTDADRTDLPENRVEGAA